MSEKNQEELGLFDTEYWTITVRLQKVIGLYCFQSDQRNCISWIYVFGFTLSFMISMGVRLINEIGFHIEIVVENIVGEMYLLVVFNKLVISVLKRKSFKKFYAKVADHWRMIDDAEELKIMTDNMRNGRDVVKLYSIFIIIGTTIFLSMPIFSPLLDYVVPLKNATRPKALPYYAEYGVDIEEYYYPLIAQAIFGGVGTITVLVTFDLGFMMLSHYVIGLFALAKYRLSKVNTLMRKIEERNGNPWKSNWPIPYIVEAVNVHRQALAYVAELEDGFNIAWFITLILNMMMFGGGMAILVLKNNPEDMFRYTMVLLASFVHFYYIFLPGQEIINASEEVFDVCCACGWYNLSEKSKLLVQFIMVRSLQYSYLTGGKMFPLSMETYCNMMKTGLSGFTIMQNFMEF
ncbi:hypothetical protein TKK_0018375 [Trichogramma kaykai]|uniref:Odorant receptor n=1 Tax=Trichogramma kaykai TaxID=54128 RepID=A0ABD2VYL3_9HYME